MHEIDYRYMRPKKAEAHRRWQDGFDPDKAVAVRDMVDLDKWAVSAFNDLVKNVRAGYEIGRAHV